jgi:hypothetical protein
MTAVYLGESICRPSGDAGIEEACEAALHDLKTNEE